ncbi:DNA repair protein [Algirhabdus cladophorae]|uniref:DNA repair protein n=1 Tax=Algirhabdus cladophorae TaxID=3377108 RepID=UPI003B8475CF
MSFTISAVRRFLQLCALGAITVLTLASVGTTLAAAFGVLDWITITVTVAGSMIQHAGMYLQIGVSAFLVGLCFFLPTNGRIFALEQSHRDFSMTMDDVTRAYQVAHAADRAGAFELAREFDSMRDRMDYLRDHPDLETLEPGLLELAAKLSFESRELAQIYSNEKIERAHTFLRQRKQELEQYQDRITAAHRATTEIKEWIAQIDLDKNVVEAQLDRLENDLREVLPLVGLDVVSNRENIVQISSNDAPKRPRKGFRSEDDFEAANVTPAE